jgi:ABC-type amino acid transport substrate-binding protein
MNKNIITNIVVTLVIVIFVQLVWPHDKTTTVSTTEAKKEESVLERIKRTGTIRCGYLLWPLFFDLDPNTKQLTGLYKDFTDTVAGLAGWKVEYVQLVAGSEITDLKSGHVDAMCGYGPWYMNSIKEVNFTRPLAYASAYMYGRIDETRFKSLDDINNQNFKLIGIDGDVSTDLAQRLYPKAKLQALPGISDGAATLLSVATGKADATITDPLTVAGFNKNNSNKIKSLFPNQPIATYGMEFGVNKGETELLQTLDMYSDMALNLNMIDPILKKYDPDGSIFLPVIRPYQIK